MRAFIVIVACFLSGCAGAGLTPNTMQFSRETMPAPQSYQVDAARVVAQKRGDPGFVRVSVPRTTIGQSAWSPQRWYVCIKGLPPPVEKPGLPTVSELVGRTLDPANNAHIYDVLLFYGKVGARPSVRDGYDSELCRDAQFEALTAEPPPT